MLFNQICKLFTYKHLHCLVKTIFSNILQSNFGKPYVGTKFEQQTRQITYYVMLCSDNFLADLVLPVCEKLKCVAPSAF